MPRLKGTAARLALAAALLCGGVRGVAGQAGQAAVPPPEDRVILLQDPAAPARESLVQALSIHLSGLASFERRTLPPGQDPATQAERQAGEPGTLAVLWMPNDQADGDATALEAVGLGESGLRREQLRVPGGPRPDVERSLALKVRELVHELRRSRPALVQPPAAATTPAEETVDASPASPFGLALSAGVLAAPLADRVQWGAVWSAGVAYREPSLRVIGALELAWSPEVEVAAAASHARLEQLTPGLIGRAELRQGDVWLGAHAAFSLSFVHAEGSNGREHGEARKQLASARLGLHLELPVAEGFGLYGGLGLELRMRRQHFTVEGVELLDLGRLRPVANLALSWTWPPGP